MIVHSSGLGKEDPSRNSDREGKLFRYCRQLAGLLVLVSRMRCARDCAVVLNLWLEVILAASAPSARCSHETHPIY